MDSLTHLMVAGTLAQAGVRTGRPWRSLALLAVASVASDAEILVRPFSPSLYLRLYHGPLHSLIGAVLIAAALALVFRQRPTPIPRPLAIALAGAGFHLFLDFFHGYGEQLLWPFTSRRYGVPLVAQFDVAVLAILGLAIVGPALLNLVNREIGAPRVSGARAAQVGLALLALLLPARAFFRARAYATANTALVEEHESIGVFPSALLPWRWNAVEDTSIAYLLYEVDGWAGRMRPFPVRLRKPIPNNLLVTARESETARAFLELAAYPSYSLGEGRRGVLVRIRDLAFFSPGGSERPYSVEIDVTSTGRILDERALF